MEYAPQSKGCRRFWQTNAMLIGELSKKTGLSKDTIRFYEKIGLISASSRQAGKRIYKEYPEKAVGQLFLINRSKELGFTLNEIKQILDDRGISSKPSQEQIQVIDKKLKEVTKKKKQLIEIEAYLSAKLGRLKQNMAKYSSKKRPK